MTLIHLLARETGISTKDVRRLIATAPKRYKVFPIPKRNGQVRLIAQPALEIKTLQRVLMARILSQFPIHPAAFAYVKGKSIRLNALMHAKSNFILKLDFTNFFHSIRPRDLEKILLSVKLEGVERFDFEDIYSLAFWGAGTIQPYCLSIGAPSSPMISNVVMFDIDKRASEVAASLDLVYTRYADDITVSGARRGDIEKFERAFTAIIRDSTLALALNDLKRGLYGRGERRMVTGLVITPDGAISIGRERKREIRAGLHRLLTGEGDDRLLMKCQGLLAFVISAEPSFLRSLIRSYGRDHIRYVMRAPRISFYGGE